MKKHIFFVIIFSYYFFSTAQVPERMSYQAVLRDHQNQLVTNQRVGMQITILHDSPNGTVFYVERQIAITNGHGLVSLEVGDGQVISGLMANIHWNEGSWYIKTEIDLTGGLNYTLMNVSQLSTVPYAFHAKTADTLTHPTPEADPVFTAWNKNYNDLTNRPIIPVNVSQLNNDAGYLNTFTETDPHFAAWGFKYDSLRNVPAVRLKLDSVLVAGNDGKGIQIKNIADPIDAQDAVTKIAMETYVANSTQLRVSYFGDTLFLGTSQWVRIPGISVAMYGPKVITDTISNITDQTATSGGDVTVQGYSTVIARGVCWSTSPNPTTADSHTSDNNGVSTFISSLSGLLANTTYYVRAYATNSVGTAYGENRSFTTLPPPPCSDGVTDINGNHYDGVEIGTQCWIKQNLRVTKYFDGTDIELGTETSTDVAYRYNPNDDGNIVSTYGYLYNWKAVMNNSSSSTDVPSGVQGICPIGWHVPSDAEWTQLTDYVSSRNDYYCGTTSSYIAKALASEIGWIHGGGTCAVGESLSTNNATGFSAVPAGTYFGNYNLFGKSAYLWSATAGSSADAYYRGLYNDDAEVYQISNYNYYAFTVRCLRN